MGRHDPPLEKMAEGARRKGGEDCWNDRNSTEADHEAIGGRTFVGRGIDGLRQ